MEMDTDISPQKLSTEERERMVRSFAVWLDHALEDEQRPEGLTTELICALRNGDPLPPMEGAERGGDLYSLWAAMTALSQEVRVQGRLFKQLNETLVQQRQASAPEAGLEEFRSGQVAAPR